MPGYLPRKCRQVMLLQRERRAAVPHMLLKHRVLKTHKLAGLLVKSCKGQQGLWSRNAITAGCRPSWFSQAYVTDNACAGKRSKPCFELVWNKSMKDVSNDAQAPDHTKGFRRGSTPRVFVAKVQALSPEKVGSPSVMCTISHRCL